MNVPPTKPSRPLGITLLACLFLLGAILFFILPLLASDRNSGSTAELSVVYGLFLLLVAGGLWFMQVWGRWMAIASTGFNLVLGLTLNASQAVTGADILRMLLEAAILIYLFSPGVSQAFAQAAR